MARVLLAVTGSIGAFKACSIASLLVQRGHSVDCILTRAACELVSPNSFQGITARPVHTEMFDPGASGRPSHLALTDECDVALVAPATANALAKMAHGIADDLFSTAMLCVKTPLVVCPAMNERMWANVAVQENVRVIAARGARIVGPGVGQLACGTSGPGRLAEPPEVVSAVEEALALPGTAPASVACRPFRMPKDRWVEVMQAAGFTREAMADWHRAFERLEPEAHAAFLASLGIPAGEVARIRREAGGS